MSSTISHAKLRSGVGRLAAGAVRRLGGGTKKAAVARRIAESLAGRVSDREISRALAPVMQAPAEQAVGMAMGGRVGETRDMRRHAPRRRRAKKSGR